MIDTRYPINLLKSITKQRITLARKNSGWCFVWNFWIGHNLDFLIRSILFFALLFFLSRRFSSLVIPYAVREYRLENVEMSISIIKVTKQNKKKKRRGTWESSTWKYAFFWCSRCFVWPSTLISIYLWL